MYSCILTGALYGMNCHIVHVEVDTSPGLPCFQMVGFLGSEVKEARERIRVAMKNTGIRIPPLSIHVNLSPADIRKEGTAYDLPMALGILASIGEVKLSRLENVLVIGELGLDGEVKPVHGILAIVKEAMEQGIRSIILPSANVQEASVVEGMTIIGVHSLEEVISLLALDTEYMSAFFKTGEGDGNTFLESLNRQGQSGDSPEHYDFADVCGQRVAKRAAEVAAAGFHHLLMIGAPGTGKSMIAQRMASILPPLSLGEALEVSSVYSVAGRLNEQKPFITSRPFISPHHTVTKSALAGGGMIPRPGLISLAHKGVLFLDELTEFRRETLDLLREPLEEKQIHIARITGGCTYPADFMLVAACNPCPCGYYPDHNYCNCSPSEVDRYLGKLSGPILDRIDLCTQVEALKVNQLHTASQGESSEVIRNRVMLARDRQLFRYQGSDIVFNSQLQAKEIRKYCPLGIGEQRLVEDVFEQMHLSARSYHRVLKVARTIADLEGSDEIKRQHLAEALTYRLNGSRIFGT